MKHLIEDKEVHAIMSEFSDLEKLLTERISDLHEVKGGMQARHAYVFYRKELSSIKYRLQQALKPHKQ